MNDKKFTVYYNSPIGNLKISTTEKELISVRFVEQTDFSSSIKPLVLKECLKQLDEYFTHQRKQFNIQLNPQGTDFQKRVWQELLNIPYGQTVSYSDIAKGIGNTKSSRAVGRANGSNPIAIIIPCHRVIGANGKLIGYGGGLWRKKWLLKHEVHKA